jgi:nitroreductase
MGNMMNAAHALGLGSCWIHRAKEEFATEYGKSLLSALGIEGEWEGIGHCVLGYADGPLPAARARKEGWVHYV